jgi:endoglycosylceramidase
MFRHVLLTLLVLLPSACSPRPTENNPPPAPGWHVSNDGFLRDPDGRAMILRGVNLAGRHKEPPYFDFHQPADFQVLSEQWGFNSVRFLLEWAALEPQPDTYDDAYLDAVALRLDWAQQAGLMVVLDMHQDVYGEGFPGGNGAPRWTCAQEHYDAFVPQAQWFLNYLDPNVVACFDALWTDISLQDHLARAWRHVAQRVGPHPAVVGFDVLNEPYLGSFALADFEPQALQPFYERVVSAVRQDAPHWVAFLEPSSMRNLGFPSTLAPFPFPNVVYAPHSYDSSAERGMGFDPARRPDVEENARKLQEEAHALHAALWVGEFGGTSSSPNLAPYLDAEQDAFSSVLAGSTVWEYGRNNGYGLLNPDGTEKPQLLQPLVRPAPQRVAGTPVSWTYDDAAQVLEFSFQGNPQSSVPTVFTAPLRVWPLGPRVLCNGCTATTRPGFVDVVASSSGLVSVTLRHPP